MIIALALAGCGSPMMTVVPPPVIKTINIYPVVPGDMLECAAEPMLGDVKTDAQFGIWTEDVRQAGAGCRAKVKAIRDLVATWPR